MSRKTILIIGCGGIGCHLAPALSLTHDLVLMDGDNYEPKNFGRQFPALDSTENKAQVLCKMLNTKGRKVSYVPKYFRQEEAGETFNSVPIDLVISAVDNNLARVEIHQWCREVGLPMIMAGNTDAFGEAFAAGSLFNPFLSYDFPMDSAPNPARCNADGTLDDTPQTVTANFFAAACALHIMQSWLTVKNIRNVIGHSKMDLRGSTTITVKQILEPVVEPESVPA